MKDLKHLSNKEHFQLTSYYTNPQKRYFNGHFITAKQLKELQVRK